MKLLTKLWPFKSEKSYQQDNSVDTHGLKKVVLVGSPNVGKSVIFNRLTSVYATVSNYPGTTVMVTRGKGYLGGEHVEVVDTPGMYSLLPVTEEETVTRRLLLSEHPEIVIHVVDAKNLSRTLPLTLQLLEAGLPVILDVNIMDEAERMGLRINTEKLSKRLGIPVIATVSTAGRGIKNLKKVVGEYVAAGIRTGSL
ncbi:MAG TPA: iron transporter [Desulfotomaculum sp.]|jgi:ferrous iron transport protein B|nr:iron transporter [Desulfotomaculum sp.]